MSVQASAAAPRLALYTFGVFRLPSEHPANDGFHARNDANFLAAEESAGFIARSGYDDEPEGPESWGEQVYPRFYVERGDGWSPATLSLWTDLTSLMIFAYSGIHAEAMRHARDWFEKGKFPGYALWWVSADETPHWRHATTRLEHLHDHGPSPFAFDFKTAFDAEGRRVEVDKEAVRKGVRG
jgi:hypothetical protein